MPVRMGKKPESTTKPASKGGKPTDMKTVAKKGASPKGSTGARVKQSEGGRNGASKSGKKRSDASQQAKKKEESLAKRLKATSEAQRDARHELVVKCNKLWNELRSKDLESDKRVTLCTELFRLLKGKVLSFSQRPDTSRVIQSIFKFGDSMVRKAILDELTGHFAALSKGKHSAFLVVTLLRYGDEQDRSKVAIELRENVRSLGTHANGARVVNYCICGSPAESTAEDVITDAERKRFYEQFYGSEVLLLSGKAAQTTNVKDCSLAQYLPEDESKRISLVQYLKKLVLKIAEKGLLRFPFAQYLCYQVVANSNREEVCEMIPSISEAALAMVGTWEGTLAVARCLLAADAKDRKKMIKEWKGHVVDLCAHRFGWYIVARALDSVDDTKMLEKSILDELAEDMDKLKALLCQEDGFGRKVFLRLLAPESRLSHYFEKFDENFLRDPAGLSTSKKDAQVRNAEVFSKMKDTLYEVIASDAETLLNNIRATDVIRELFHRSLASDEEGISSEARTKAIEAIVAASTNCLEDARGHVTLKRLVKDETEMIQSKKLPSSETDSVAAQLARHLSGRMQELAKTNRPAFVLEALALNPLSRDKVTKELTAAVAKKLPKDVKGTEALVKALSSK